MGSLYWWQGGGEVISFSTLCSLPLSTVQARPVTIVPCVAAVPRSPHAETRRL